MLPFACNRVTDMVEIFISDVDGFLNEEEAYNVTRDQILDYVLGCIAVDYCTWIVIGIQMISGKTSTELVFNAVRFRLFFPC